MPGFSILDTQTFSNVTSRNFQIRAEFDPTVALERWQHFGSNLVETLLKTLSLDPPQSAWQIWQPFQGEEEEEKVQ